MDDDEVKKVIDFIVSHSSNDFVEVTDYEALTELANAIDTIWKLEAIQHTFELRLKRMYAFYQNMNYYFNVVHQIFSEEYEVNMEHELRKRLRTTGYIDYDWTHDQYVFKIVDMGGMFYICGIRAKNI